MFRTLLFLVLTVLAFGPARADAYFAKTYNSEMMEALKYLQAMKNKDDREFILFLTTFNVPTTVKVQLSNRETLSLREAMVPLLNFTIHSLSGGAVIRKVVPITDTLFYVDIRDYDWTQEALEKVSFADPYFKEPWVDHDAYTAMLIEDGTAILRADWFIAHTTDVLKQVDADREPLYYELLYAKTGIPKNVKDFQDRWGADVNRSIKNKTARGTIIDHGQSIVARHNRQLFRTRTDSGYYWETQDVKNEEGGRDFIENLVPFLRKKDFDATETIASNKLQLQVYGLFNGQGNRIEFADNAIATDGTKINDKRVGTGRSCIVCHNGGINDVSNALQTHLDVAVDLQVYLKEDALDIESFFLDPRLYQDVEDDQAIFARAVKAVCGISPSRDAILIYSTFMEWYEKPLDLTQAALEVGKPPEEFKAKEQLTVRGRLGYLIKGGVIPREIWEEPNRGAFTEAMLFIYHLEGQRKLLEVPQPQIKRLTYKVIEAAPVWNGPKPVVDADQNQIIIPVGKMFYSNKVRDGWIRVRYNGKEGFINSQQTKLME